MRREWIEMSITSEIVTPFESPSMRREWIEISNDAKAYQTKESLPPCGGSGLKYFHGGPFRSVRRSPSMRREWIEISCHCSLLVTCLWSPSMRREWIEIFHLFNSNLNASVSLHAEGVD